MDKVLPTVDNTPLGESGTVFVIKTELIDVGVHYCLFLMGEDDILDVLEQMMPVVNSWKAIGRGLQIDSGRLEMIQKDNPVNSKENLSEMFTCWLKRNYNVARFDEPTWQAVVKVVAHPAGRDNCAFALSIACFPRKNV